MTEIKLLMEHVADEINDAETYAKLALEYKDTDKELADVFYRLSGEELEHMNRLHAQVVRLIEERKRSGAEIPADMMPVYRYLHKQQIERTTEVGVAQALYRGK